MVIKKLIIAALLLCICIAEVSAQSNVILHFSVSNPSSTARNAEVVSIPWKEVLLKHPAIDKENFKVVSASTQDELPFQLEYRGETIVQNLLIQVNVPAHQTLKIALINGKPTSVSQKTFGRYVPERKDDFAWENDKIAFRMYGKKLEGTNENAYGLDVWVKRTERLIINERYAQGEYHTDHGDGLDYYHVGLSLGAGNMAPFVDDTIRYSKNYDTWKMLDNGPLRTTFQLGFNEWDVAGTPVKATKIISLDAGSQLNRIEVTYSFKNSNPLPVVAGIVKRPETSPSLLDEQSGILGYWEPQHGMDGTTGVGVIFVKANVKMISTKDQFLAQTTVNSNAPIVYYTGAAWNKGGLITSAEAWFAYLNQFKECLQNPLKVSVQ